MGKQKGKIVLAVLLFVLFATSAGSSYYFYIVCKENIDTIKQQREHDAITIENLQNKVKQFNNLSDSINSEIKKLYDNLQEIGGKVIENESQVQTLINRLDTFKGNIEKWQKQYESLISDIKHTKEITTKTEINENTKVTTKDVNLGEIPVTKNNAIAQ